MNLDTTKKITNISSNGVNFEFSADIDSNIQEENIKKDVTILGVTGTYEGGGVSTQSQSIFTGYTAPLTWLNSTNNVFEYKSNTHNITISGLSSIATISGNGTKSVTVTIDTTASADRQTAFTITCVNGDQTLTYNGIEFHYGSDLGTGNCLAVAQTIANNQIAYVFIESASLPLFGDTSASWNSVYSHQIITFDFGKWNETSIGGYFLAWGYSFNQPLTIPNNVTSIDQYFLRFCSPFNQPLTIPNNVTSIGNYFLYGCYSFNQPLTVPSGVTSISEGFLLECYAFNQPLTIPDGVIVINGSFLSNCSAFNQPLTIPSSVTVIRGYFLSGCSSFNQPLTIPSGVTTIFEYFLYNCRSFNQLLTIPSRVTSIGQYFLANCYSFNQPLIIPSSVTTIGQNFLSSCFSFNQSLTIPSSVRSIGQNYFLYNCRSLIYLEYNASVYPTGTYSLSQDFNTKTSASGTGILVVGTHASDLKNALPDRASSPYRKLVLAGV